jgi:hypothetical protein
MADAAVAGDGQEADASAEHLPGLFGFERDRLNRNKYQ